jgi:hypothetical protein
MECGSSLTLSHGPGLAGLAGRGGSAAFSDLIAIAKSGDKLPHFKKNDQAIGFSSED